VPDHLFFCQAGLTGFHIDSRGRLSPCLMSRQPSYDLRTGTFDEGWASFLPAVVRKKRERVSPCQQCRLHALCDYCPGWAQLEGDDPELPVDHLCRLAHLRAQALDVGCGERSTKDDLFNRERFSETKVREATSGKSGICSRGGGI
jgi:radical SAM protein with 4Fe4S-binding SPASM domain